MLAFKRLLYINTAQNSRLIPWSRKEKKYFLKWSRKEQNLTPDIFSYKCRIEIKLSTHTDLNINQNFWVLYAQLDSFIFFMTTLLVKAVTEGIRYDHYTPSMIASKVVLRTSSKKSRIKPPKVRKWKWLNSIFPCTIPEIPFDIWQFLPWPCTKNMPYFQTVPKTFATYLGWNKDGTQKLGLWCGTSLCFW